MEVLLYVSGLGVGLALAAGVILGAWIQRKVKAEIVREQHLVETREKLEKALIGEEDRYEELDEPVGIGHPGGPVPPTHAEASRKQKKARVSELFARMGVGPK